MQLEARIGSYLVQPLSDEIADIAAALASENDADVVLFYGSNLRTGSLEGVIDFYLLTPGPPERGIWPRVSYREWQSGGRILRTKVATMSLTKFCEAASGRLLDTTIWARFVQPCAIAWQRDESKGAAIAGAIASCCTAAGRLAVALGPDEAAELVYWTSLFKATYSAEFRLETASRAHSILELNPRHFDGLLPVALEASGMACERTDRGLRPHMTATDRRRILRWWRLRRLLAKPINMIRLVYATFTFQGAARYAAWKIERHTGISIRVTPWRERHPVLATPMALLELWGKQRKQR